MCYNENYQQMRLSVLCLYFLFLVFSRLLLASASVVILTTLADSQQN